MLLRARPGPEVQSAPQARTRPGWRDPALAPFRRLAAVVSTHSAGDIVVAVALANTIFFGLPVDAARERVALYLALSMTPVALLTPAATALLAGRAAHLPCALRSTAAIRVLVALALLAAAGTWLLFPLALVLLVASRVHGISRTAFIPDVTPPGRPLVWANTWMSATSTAGAMLGAGVGAAAVALGGTAPALLLAAGCYLIAAVAAPSAAGQGRVGASAPVSAWRTLRARVELPPRAASAGLALGVLRVATGVLTFLLAFAVKDQPGLLTAIVVAAALGGGLGTFAANSLRNALPQWLIPPLLLAVLGVVAASVATNVNSLAGAALAGAAGFAWSAGKVAFDGEMQQVECVAERRRVVARYTVAFQLLWLLGAAASMPPMDVGYAVAALGLGCLIGAVAAISRSGLGLSVFSGATGTDTAAS